MNVCIQKEAENIENKTKKLEKYVMCDKAASDGEIEADGERGTDFFRNSDNVCVIQ